MHNKMAINTHLSTIKTKKKKNKNRKRTSRTETDSQIKRTF